MVQKNGSLARYWETPRRENRPGMIQGIKLEEETEWRNFCHQPVQKGRQQRKFSALLLEAIDFSKRRKCIWYDMIYLLTAIGLSPGGSSTLHIYKQTLHRTTQNKQYIAQHNNLGECGPCPVLASYSLAFALQLRKKHGKTSVRVVASMNT